jgi:hypothetical protein
MEDLRFDIVKLLLAHGIPAPDLVPTARDVLAFVSEQAPQADVLPTTSHLVVDTKEPEPPVTDRQLAIALQAYDDLKDLKEKSAPFVRWTPERVVELERWRASGASNEKIAQHFGTTQKAVSIAADRFGIAARWPRRTKKLMFTPIPLDAPWPADQAAPQEPEVGIMPTPADTVPAREVPPARRARPVCAPMIRTQSFILDWLNEHNVDAAEESAGWRWEQETGLTFRQILARANNLRIRQGLSPFADPEPDPLALPVGADGGSICGSSLGNIG